MVSTAVPRAEHRHRPSAEDMAAFTDARIAALKAGLELTPDQAKNWPAFEQALRDVAQLRIQRMQAREARHQQGQTPATGPDPDQSVRSAGASGRQHGQDQRRAEALADTGAPLYQSLTDAQKHRFTMLARMSATASSPHAGRQRGWLAARPVARSRRSWIRTRWRTRRPLVRARGSLVRTRGPSVRRGRSLAWPRNAPLDGS